MEDTLLKDLDRFLNGNSRGRSAFIREAIEKALRRKKLDQMIEQEAEAYRRFPQTEEELIPPEACYWGDDEDWSDWERQLGSR
jgi:hypothetical protein